MKFSNFVLTRNYGYIRCCTCLLQSIRKCLRQINFSNINRFKFKPPRSSNENPETTLDNDEFSTYESDKVVRNH